MFGPLHPDRVRVVLDYHGTDGQPAGRLAEIAARPHVTSRTVCVRGQCARNIKARSPLLGNEKSRRQGWAAPNMIAVRISSHPYIQRHHTPAPLTYDAAQPALWFGGAEHRGYLRWPEIDVLFGSLTYPPTDSRSQP